VLDGATGAVETADPLLMTSLQRGAATNIFDAVLTVCSELFHHSSVKY
jgi:hypothetical protein